MSSEILHDVQIGDVIFFSFDVGLDTYNFLIALSKVFLDFI